MPAYGVMFDWSWITPDALGAIAANRVGYARVTFIFDASLDYHEPFVAYDGLVAAAAEKGATILPVLIKSGAAADADFTSSPEQLARWRRFALQLALRYGPEGTLWESGSLPYRPIRAWEIWNEQNIAPFGDLSPKAYRIVLREARAGLRDGDSQARIVFGGLSFASEALQYLQDVASNEDARCLFDAVAVHPYGDSAADALAKVKRTYETLVDMEISGKDPDRDVAIWLTEIGWAMGAPEWPHCLAEEDGKCVETAQFTVPGPDAQAKRMAEFARRLDEHRRAWRIGPTIWYAYGDLAPTPAEPEQKWWMHAGLFANGPSGMPAEPRPAWTRAGLIGSKRATVRLPPVRCPNR